MAVSRLQAGQSQWGRLPCYKMRPIKKLIQAGRKYDDLHPLRTLMAKRLRPSAQNKSLITALSKQGIDISDSDNSSEEDKDSKMVTSKHNPNLTRPIRIENHEGLWELHYLSLNPFALALVCTVKATHSQSNSHGRIIVDHGLTSRHLFSWS